MTITLQLPDDQEPEAKPLRILLTELAAELVDVPVLSEEALARSSIYDDHS